MAVDLGNVLLRAALVLAKVLLLAAGFFAIEHPEPREGFPSIFRLPETQELLQAEGVQLSLFDQCEFGQFAKKGTAIVSNMPGVYTTFNARRCTHHRGAHKLLQGLNADGRFVTSLAQEYPPAMCEGLATATIQAIRTRPDTAGGQKVRVPPASGIWAQQDRWKLLFKSKWERSEHQNALELRTLVNLGRHLARSSKCWNQRYLVFTDSLVCLGALGKGRSSSPSLLRLLRRWAAIRMATQITMALRWIPTEDNAADGPSRDGAVGAHPSEPSEHRVSKPAVRTFRGQG